MSTDIEIAWLAGLYEGEGCIYRAPRNCLTLSIKMNDEDIVRRACAVAGYGSVRGPYNHWENARQPHWAWSVSRRNHVLAVVEMIRPWLGERRTVQVDQAIGDLKTHPPQRELAPRPPACDYVRVGELTTKGAKMHTRRGELPCLRCAEANRLYLRRWRSFKEANP